MQSAQGRVQHKGLRSTEQGRTQPISPAGAHRARVTAHRAGLCPRHAHCAWAPLPGTHLSPPWGGWGCSRVLGSTLSSGGRRGAAQPARGWKEPGAVQTHPRQPSGRLHGGGRCPAGPRARSPMGAVSGPDCPPTRPGRQWGLE